MRLTVVLSVMLVLGGCGKESGVDTPHILTYVGTYMWRNPTVVITAAKIDSVEFKITDGVLYTLRFHQLDPTDMVDFCDCDGRIDQNTSSVMSFDPTVVIYSGCDSLRIPRGDFVPDYVSHRPDTVYFEQRDDTTLYRLIVLQR